MRAAWPAAGPALARRQILATPVDALAAGLRLLRGFDPADPLVARERRDIEPGRHRFGLRFQCRSQIGGEIVDDTARNALLVSHGAVDKANAGLCKSPRWARAYRAIVASAGEETHFEVMLNILSLLIGVVALALGLLAFLPLLGWAYWLIIPVALVGLGLGIVSRHNSGRNLNLLVIVVGILRLMLGGGIV
jgi:hypothetical protein